MPAIRPATEMRSQQLTNATVAPPTVVTPPGLRGTPVQRCLTAGLATGASAYVATMPTATRPWVLLGLALALMLLTPTAPELSRRMVLNGTTGSVVLVLVGLAPASTVRVPIAVAAACGIVAAVLSARGWRRELPNVSKLDLLIPTSGVAALTVSWPLVGRSATSALAELMGGWDHAGHFSMYLAHREGISRAVPAGKHWYYADYPQLFHALTARFAELTYGSVGSATEELVRYATIQALAYCLIVMAAVAITVDMTHGLSKTSRLSACVMVAGLVLGFPGASLLVQGYLSVLWAIVSGACLIQLSRRQQAVDLPTLAAAACCTVAVASWPLLLPIVAQPALALLRAGVSGRSWQFRIATSGLAAAAGSGTLYLLWVSGRADPGEHLVTAGGIVHPGLVVTFAIPVILGLIALRSPASNYPWGWRPLQWAAWASCALLVGIASLQLILDGQLSYYFWKSALAAQTMLLIVALPDLAEQMRLTLRRHAPGLTGRAAEAVAATLIAVLGLGAASGTSSLSTGFVARASLAQWSTQRDVAADIMTVRSTTGLTFSNFIWVRETDEYAPALPDQWLHSLTRSRTTEIGDFQTLLNEARYSGPDGLAQVARTVLTTSDLNVVVSDPRVLEATRSGVGPALQGRVTLLPAHAR